MFVKKGNYDGVLLKKLYIVTQITSNNNTDTTNSKNNNNNSNNVKEKDKKKYDLKKNSYRVVFSDDLWLFLK